MLTKNYLEQIGKLLQAQNENTKHLIEASEKRMIERMTEKIEASEKRMIGKIEKMGAEILDTVSQGFDGLQPVLDDLEKRVGKIEQERHISKN